MDNFSSPFVLYSKKQKVLGIGSPGLCLWLVGSFPDFISEVKLCPCPGSNMNLDLSTFSCFRSDLGLVTISDFGLTLDSFPLVDSSLYLTCVFYQISL